MTSGYAWQPNIEKGDPEPEPDEEQSEQGTERAPSTWERVDLGPFLDGDYSPPMPTIGQRDDGVHLFYPSRIHSLFSEPEAGKTWFAMIVTASEMQAGNDVAFIDFEDSFEGVVPRLLTLGVAPDVIRKQFIYIRPEEAPSLGDKSLLFGAITPQTTLVWIDGVTEAMALFGLRPKEDTEVAQFWKHLPRPLAKRGPAVVLLDHVVKNQDARGRWATGSQHKLSGLNGVGYVLENITPFGVGLTGRTRVWVSKDRPGQVRRHAVVSQAAPPPMRWLGDMVIRSEPGGVLANLYPPRDADGTGGGAAPAAKRPVEVMEKVSRFLEKAVEDAEAKGDDDWPGYSKNVIEQAIGGRAATVRAALEILVSDGYVSAAKVKSATLHRPENPFRAKDES